MSPMHAHEMETSLVRRLVTKPTNPDGLILEAWAQGYMVGSLIIMACITLSNMRRGVLLHKLILLELILGVWHGFFIFFHYPVYNWWLSVSAIPLNMSWSLHNVIAWIKIKPFLPRYTSIIFIGTVVLVQPYWVVEIYANFTYFHNINDVFLHTRPFEALCRDPWWIFTTVALFYNIKTRYELSLTQIVRISPRFAVMLGAMLLSICFIVLDICSVTDALKSSLPVGINPFWKLSFVFKCLTDSVILDDFKTALDRLRAFKISRMGSFAVDDTDRRSRGDGQLEHAWAEVQAPNGVVGPPSPDGDYLHPQWQDIKSESKHVERPQSGYEPNTSNDSHSEDTEAISHGDQHPPGDASDSHNLKPQADWLGDSSVSEYAKAMRELASDSAESRAQ